MKLGGYPELNFGAINPPAPMSPKTTQWTGPQAPRYTHVYLGYTGGVRENLGAWGLGVGWGGGLGGQGLQGEGHCGTPLGTPRLT